ncbi:pyruvate carboxylase subunit B [archaeon MnTg01]|nr:pyruvate carboxylase subunit B [archaeon MnTg01]
MEYKIEDIEDVFNAEIIQQLGNLEYLIKINDNEKNLKILTMSSRGIEFILDQKYHKVKYLNNTTSQMKIVVNGVPITVNMHQNFNEIVFKNSGDSGTGDSQLNLHSQIPGKVIKISVSEGSEVKKDDVICVLESMKMQVSVKSHKDGVVKKIKVKESATVAKNDIIAEIE